MISGRAELSVAASPARRHKPVRRRARKARVVAVALLLSALLMAPVSQSVRAQLRSELDQWGTEEEYARVLASQYWDHYAGVTETLIKHWRVESPLKAFELDANGKWFEDHGFMAWAEVNAPFEHYGGNSLQMDRFSLAEFRFADHDTVYPMGNQPPYTAQLGTVPFTFQGGSVRMVEGGSATGSNCNAKYNFLYAYPGWANDDMRAATASDGSGAVNYHHAWLKGYLTRHIVLINSGSPDSCGLSTGDYVYRYQYHAPGGKVVNFYQRPAEAATRSSWSIGPCNSRTENRTPEPTSYWSDDGSAMLDTSSPCRPKIRWSDGSLEEFHAPDTVEWPVGLGGSVARWYDMPSSCNLHSDLKIIDRNGNISRYTFTPTSESVIDPKGRETKVTFQSSPNTPDFVRLLTVETPAPGGGAPLKYQVNWRAAALAVNFASIWPDVACHGLNGATTPCGTSNVDVVDSITIPDGRAYTFTYTPWGSLDTVGEPNGAVRKYTYGDAANTVYAQNTLPLINRLETFSFCGELWSGEMLKVQARGVTSESVYPSGTGVAETTSITYEKVDLETCQTDTVGAAVPGTGPDACVQVWKVITNPDGSKKRIGMAASAVTHYINSPPLNSGPPSPHGWEIGTEKLAPGGALVAAVYNGDKVTGQLYYDFETASTLKMPLAAVVDRRPSRVVNVKDGVTSTNAFAYGDLVDIDPGTGVVNRNTTNITKQCAWSGSAPGCNSGSGTKLSETNTSYFHPAAYLQQNILRLPASQTVTDPLRGVLTRTDYAYDEYTPAVSGSVNLDTSIGATRGNVTSVTSYRNAAGATLPVVAHKKYFDTGDVQQNIDANGKVTGMSYDFGLCSASHKVLVSAVTSPTVIVNGNNVSLITTTVGDCFSGLTLRATDANGQSTFTQYDNLGRVVETAAPRDTLTPLPPITIGAAPPAGELRYLRDPDIPSDRLNTGTAVGNSGRGPTTWTEYRDLGAVTPTLKQRVVTHAKDGTSDGRYTKTFTDGLDRTRQTRTEVDPATSGGSAEVVTTTEYDLMGRVQKSYAAYFAGGSDIYASPPSGAKFVLMEYEALGRAARVTPPGLSATVTGYGKNPTANEYMTTVTDGKGNQTQSFSDVLGRVLRVARQSDLCTGGWCVRTMEYDAAGRLLRATEASGAEQMSFTYDGLGRKTEMIDKDMGTWSYLYDDNGNLTRQTDARGIVIEMFYDPLNRVTRKDLPPNSSTAGPEDTTYFYDGSQPSP